MNMKLECDSCYYREKFRKSIHSIDCPMCLNRQKKIVETHNIKQSSKEKSKQFINYKIMK